MPCKHQVIRSIRIGGSSPILSHSSSGQGHQVFILVDRGSNPLCDSIFCGIAQR